MQLKMDGDKAVLDNGLPVIVYADGSEKPLDFVHLIGKVKDTADKLEAAQGQLSSAKERLAKFGDASDEEIVSALSKVKTLNGKQVLTAEEIEAKVREQTKGIAEQHERARSELEQKLREQTERNGAILRSHAFATSKLVDPNKLTLTEDALEALFGRHFVPDGTRLVPYRRLPKTNGPDDAGEKIFSSTRHGEVADFDEALTQLIEAHPNRDRWKVGPNARGGGAPGGNNQPGGSDLNDLPPEQALSKVLSA